MPPPVSTNRFPDPAPLAGPDVPFTLDAFQVEAMAAIDASESVLVAAPTGSGKTVVAEHAVDKALETGGKAFYTTPIKALSNQKFHDLARRHGPDRVGLLTGDNAVNPDAPVVVMTTEVLRNMLYAHSDALEGLQWVVLDEVHYLQDTYRGPTWEEIIIHLAPDVGLVCLSATVSNAGELADWLRTVRGPTTMVLAERRPVELTHLFAVNDKFAEQLTVIPTLVDGRPNRNGERFDRPERTRNDRGGRHRGGRRGSQRRYSPPNRVDLADWLADRDMLPAIHFIFSRAGCDDAVGACLDAGVNLTEPTDTARIDEICDYHLRGLSDTDLVALGHDRWRLGLHRGVAAHHAGMVPPFKEAVEACFVEGLTKLVFATETLALGINMPARTVVIDKLTKYTGDGHEFLTAGQFTQLTGRAGRRGIDPVGNAVVLWSPFVSFADVAGLVTSRSFPLRSAFRPTYNMAANLVNRYPRHQADLLMGQSFAQYQADANVVGLERSLARRRSDLARFATDATCERGDVAEYAEALSAKRRRNGNVGQVPRRRRDALPLDEARTALAALRPGDVISGGGTQTGGAAAVLSVSHRKGGGVRVRTIGATRRVNLVSERDLASLPEVIGHITLPTPFAPRSVAFQRSVAEALHKISATTNTDKHRKPAGHRDNHEGDTLEDTVIAETNSPAGADPASHPVADCPDLAAHLDALRRHRRAQRAATDLERQIESRSGSLRRRLSRVIDMMQTWGYLDDWRLTARGQQLMGLFHECDLLVVEAVADGLFDGLDAPGLAAMTSMFVYEHRSPGPAPTPWFPPGPLRSRWDRLDTMTSRLNGDERRFGLPPTRRPDPGFVAIAHGWATGGELEEVLDDEDVTPGDFVRTMKVLIDLLGQIARIANEPATARTAEQAADLCLRDLVAASSLVNTGTQDNPDSTSFEPAGNEPDPDDATGDTGNLADIHDPGAARNPNGG